MFCVVVLHVVAEVARLALYQQAVRPFLEVLRLNDVVLADLVVQLALKVVLSREVARTDPERLFVRLHRNHAHQLNRLAPLRCAQQWVRTEPVDDQELSGCDLCAVVGRRIVANSPFKAA